jgi:glyoxylase-like metal-dependent hydrolase (beta-lactamase superfamily II)
MGMPRIESSEIRVQTVMAGSLWLDGGAMFGVVPKTLWSRRTDADERNRIQLAMRCLLIETEAATILVDTGLGNKDDDKFHDIYGVSNAGEPTRLESSLRAIGVEPGQVDIVVNTHLHFDHAGGNTVRRPDGRVEPTFPNAAYAIQRGEWDYARLDNERVQASYVADNFVPLEAAGRVRWLDGERESIVPGVEVIRTPGHTPFHQSVLVTKRHWIGRAVSESWLLGFEHDPLVAWGCAAQGDRPGRTELKDVVQDPADIVEQEEEA